jgi:hypothetical protein
MAGEDEFVRYVLTEGRDNHVSEDTVFFGRA